MMGVEAEDRELRRESTTACAIASPDFAAAAAAAAFFAAFLAAAAPLFEPVAGCAPTETESVPLRAASRGSGRREGEGWGRSMGIQVGGDESEYAVWS